MTDSNDDVLAANWPDNLIAGAAKRETEGPHERQARYLRLLDRFGDSIPRDGRMTIKPELAKSLMGEC